MFEKKGYIVVDKAGRAKTIFLRWPLTPVLTTCEDEDDFRDYSSPEV